MVGSCGRSSPSALPLPSRDFPLLVTSGFDATPLDGPVSPDLPPIVYDAYLDFMWLPKLSDRWMGILAVTPGVYSDFDALQNDAYRTKAKALLRYDWVPDRVQVLVGVLYLNRFTFNWLPAGGIIWDPHDDVHLEIVFPRPKFAYRFTASALHEDWAYVAGEFGGDTYSIRSGAEETWDMIEIVDWRVFAGIERKRPEAVPCAAKSAMSSAARSNSNRDSRTTSRATRSWSARDSNSKSGPVALRDGSLHGLSHVGGAFGHFDAGLAQRGDLLGGRALAAGDDGAGVAHAFAGRGGAAGDERGHRLGDVLLDVRRPPLPRPCRRSRRSSGSPRSAGRPRTASADR